MLVLLFYDPLINALIKKYAPQQPPKYRGHLFLCTTALNCLQLMELPTLPPLP
jgi:hypothetical protein